ncbi:MAG: GTPase HflX [Clostridia bacterium]|nr:GTPase HflX [Clostridia bacterium]
MIYGNTEGIRDFELKKLESLYDYTIEEDVFAPAELLDYLAEVTGMIGKEVSIYISRSGEILDVSIGDQNSVGLKEIHLRRNKKRLSKIRCIHTHPNGNANLSQVDLNSLKSMYFDSMASVGVVEGKATGIQASFLFIDVAGDLACECTKVVDVHAIPQRRWMEKIDEADRNTFVSNQKYATSGESEKAILVGIDTEESLKELKALAETAGAVVVGSLVQKRPKPDIATFIGQGKVHELSLYAQAKDADLIIFDDELSGIQQRNLEREMLSIRVLDRTALILDIFAQRAQSIEGQLQVEMAQLKYQLPRLVGHGVSFSRLGGGIGTRGPGETQLELDRRRIRSRISSLQKEIDRVSEQRRLRRVKREKNQKKIVALVGYTNAGKTTLLNCLSGETAFAENMLFATLDPLIREIPYPDGTDSFLLIDTVGFINKLPHTLIDAFRSTLEETVNADLLLIVSDGASAEIGEQYEIVKQVLSSIGAGDKPALHVVNKCDLASHENLFPDAIHISAKEKIGTGELLEEIEARLAEKALRLSVFIPYERAQDEAWMHRNCRIIDEKFTDSGYELVVEADKILYNQMIQRLDQSITISMQE